jgi:hypothetical protein
MTAPPSSRSTRLFVDEIDGASARLLRDEEVVSLPVALLPAGVREGDWVQLDVGIVEPPPSDAEERRRQLAKDDPGGDFKL